MLRAYVWLADEIGTAAYLENFASWDTITHDVLSTVVTFLGDYLVVSHFQLFMVITNLPPLSDLPMLHCMGQQPFNCYPAHHHGHHGDWYAHSLRCYYLP